jgi:hypothetical protein
MSLGTLATSILSGVVTAIVTAFVSVRLALRRFRSERLWDRKFQAYSDLFQALFHVKAYGTRALHRIETGGTLSDERMKELGARSAAGYDEIRKAVVVGTFTFGYAAIPSRI